MMNIERGNWHISDVYPNCVEVLDVLSGTSYSKHDSKLIDARYEESSDILYVTMISRGSSCIHVFKGAKTQPELFQYASQVAESTRKFASFSSIEFTLIAEKDGVYALTRDGKFLLKNFSVSEDYNTAAITVFGSDKQYINSRFSDPCPTKLIDGPCMFKATDIADKVSFDNESHTSLFSQESGYQIPQWCTSMYQSCEFKPVVKEFLLPTCKIYSFMKPSSFEEGLEEYPTSSSISFSTKNLEDLCLSEAVVQVSPIFEFNDMDYVALITDLNNAYFLNLEQGCFTLTVPAGIMVHLCRAKGHLCVKHDHFVDPAESFSQTGDKLYIVCKSGKFYWVDKSNNLHCGFTCDAYYLF